MFVYPGTNAIARIFLSFVRERIEVRVIRKRAFTNAFDSSPSPLSSVEEERRPVVDRLQIFLRPGLDAVERFLDVLDRVGHAEA